MATATSQDTEITLGTGKMLALFFGLVALCAVFFGIGFSLGRSSVRIASAGSPVRDYCHDGRRSGPRRSRPPAALRRPI